MNKSLLAIIVACCGAIGALLAAGVQESAQESNQGSVQEVASNTDFMQLKLDYTREIMAGLTTAEFERVEKAAQDLILMSHENDWNISTTPEYLQASSEFREKASRLRENAKQKNADGSLLVYFEVTVACVRCHEQIRN